MGVQGGIEGCAVGWEVSRKGREGWREDKLITSYHYVWGICPKGVNKNVYLQPNKIKHFTSDNI